MTILSALHQDPILPVWRFVRLMIFVIVPTYISTHAQAQDASGTFELLVPGTSARSIARLTPNELSIQDSQGITTRYQRAPRYDSAEQALIGYSSRQVQQVLRWPISNSGRMQIGVVQNGQVQFSWSKMQIQPMAGPAPTNPAGDILPPSGDRPRDALRNGFDGRQQGGSPTLLNLPQMTAMHLGAGTPNDRQYLSVEGNQFGFVPRASSAEAAWYISPVSHNVVRLQQQIGNDWFAIGVRKESTSHSSNRLGGRPLGGFGNGAFPRGGSFGGGGGFWGSTGNYPLGLSPLQNGADQLWNINYLANGGYYFESVLYPGMALTGLPGQGLYLQPLNYDPWQIWWPQAPAFVLPQPRFRSVQQQIVQNPPLNAASVTLQNSHTETLIVLLADRRNPQQPQKLRIAPRASERVQLERDAGATIIENIETMDSFGNWRQQQYSTPIPPNVLYDISVYEEFLQSIAIDRTGKSPNPIEDVNYQPRSIGFFLVPPGEELPEVADIDVYRIAEQAQNPGAVRRMNRKELEQNSSLAAPDPLKELLNKFQKQRGAF